MTETGEAPEIFQRYWDTVQWTPEIPAADDRDWRSASVGNLIVRNLKAVQVTKVLQIFSAHFYRQLQIYAVITVNDEETNRNSMKRRERPNVNALFPRTEVNNK